mmetsp:Transcript_1224/g.4338  ORF Transcript_1224/g.4338 Transcript_1224/m.4338 type:complete len:382 (-) Transcript_1224:1854-2999(-)
MTTRSAASAPTEKERDPRLQPPGEPDASEDAPGGDARKGKHRTSWTKQQKQIFQNAWDSGIHKPTKDEVEALKAPLLQAGVHYEGEELSANIKSYFENKRDTIKKQSRKASQGANTEPSKGGGQQSPGARSQGEHSKSQEPSPDTLRKRKEVQDLIESVRADRVQLLNSLSTGMTQPEDGTEATPLDSAGYMSLKKSFLLLDEKLSECLAEYSTLLAKHTDLRKCITAAQQLVAAHAFAAGAKADPKPAQENENSQLGKKRPRGQAAKNSGGPPKDTFSAWRSKKVKRAGEIFTDLDLYANCVCVGAVLYPRHEQPHLIVGVDVTVDELQLIQDSLADVTRKIAQRRAAEKAAASREEPDAETAKKAKPRTTYPRAKSRFR